ncbi:MAG: hypothetical protein V3W41_13705 [Planctomycetota bacterium]
MPAPPSWLGDLNSERLTLEIPQTRFGSKQMPVGIPRVAKSVQWRTLLGFYSKASDADGRFEICGHALENAQHQLSALGPWQGEPRPFEPGDQALSLVVFRGGFIRGWLAIG